LPRIPDTISEDAINFYISLTSAYELMHEKDFPSIKIGSRIIVPKDKFREWIDKKSGG